MCWPRVSKQPQQPQETSNYRILVGRVLFIACLCASAAVLGYTAHYFLSDAEASLAESQFLSISERALSESKDRIHRKVSGAVTLASMYGNQFPNARSWPFVAIDGFHEIVDNLMQTSKGRSIAMAPLVMPEQLVYFEAFAWDHYQANYPSGHGNTSIGFGVYARDETLDTEDRAYHDTTGTVFDYESPHKILVPVFQDQPHSTEPMFNLHSAAPKGHIIDAFIANATKTNTFGKYGSFSRFQFFNDINRDEGPGSVYLHPIFPSNNDTKLVGVIVSTILWAEILDNIFASDVSGIDCVLKSPTEEHTFSVMEGVIYYKGAGVMHDHDCKFFHCNISLTAEDPLHMENASFPYTLELFSTDEFHEGYQTRNPIIATAGAVCIIVFTSLLFFLYDFLVIKEFHEKQTILDAKKQFVRFVSHEVRTPLNTVCMGMRLMREELDAIFSRLNKAADGHAMVEFNVSAQAKKAADVVQLSKQIQSSTESAVGILDDLLFYDKIEMGQMSLELTAVPIWRLIQDTVTEFSIPARAKNIYLRMDFGSLASSEGVDSETGGSVRLEEKTLELRVIGDAVRITQALRNLLSNALKFTPEGGMVLVQTSWLEPETPRRPQEFNLSNCSQSCSFVSNGNVRICVEDSGVGMSEEQLVRVFRKGMQFNVNELQSGKGSGLGLYITKGIVELHRGTLAAASDGLGNGSTFTMTLPLHVVPGDDCCAEESLTSEASKHTSAPQGERLTSCASDDSGGTEKPLHVLVVDDVAMNRKLLSRLLVNRGRHCEDAVNGEEAVRKVEAAMKDGRPYDTILMDYEMPVMNGPTATKRIRALGCRAYIIGVTGNVLPDDVAYFKKCGADNVFAKPISMVRLETEWVENGVISTL